MDLHFKKSFQKKYNKLDLKTRKKVDKAVNKFIDDPFDISLKNHPLRGSMKNFRAISVTSDIRIIIEEFENYTVVFLVDVGTHNQVY